LYEPGIGLGGFGGRNAGFDGHVPLLSVPAFWAGTGITSAGPMG